jgi:hypothetical protein
VKRLGRGRVPVAGLGDPGPGHAGEDPEGGFAHDGWTGGFIAGYRRHNSQCSARPARSCWDGATHPGPFAESAHKALRAS